MNLSQLAIDRLYCLAITFFMPFFDILLIFHYKYIKVPLLLFTIACSYGILLLLLSFFIKVVSRNFIYFLYIIVILASLAVLYGIQLNDFGTVHLLGGLTALSLFTILFRHKHLLIIYTLFFNSIFSLLLFTMAPKSLDPIYICLIFWVVGFVCSITTIIRIGSYNKIQRMAFYDFLTNLPNSRKLIYEMESMINHDTIKAAGILFIDLDKFKTVNDNFGHRIGDKLLKIVAERLLHCVRESDTVSRMGGDEFVIFLPNIEMEDVRKISQRISLELSRPMIIEGNEIIVTPSVGVSIYPEHGNTVNLLIKHADDNMYIAKDMGTNTPCAARRLT